MSWRFSYTDSFDFSEILEGLEIKGVAFKSGKIEGKKVFIDQSELPRVAFTLKNAPLLDSHNKDTVLSTMGKVVSGVVSGIYVKYIAHVFDKKIIELIKNGLIKGVSVGLRYEELKPYGEDFTQLIGIEVVELSLTNFPAIPEASIGFSIDLPQINNNPVETFKELQKENLQLELMKELMQTIESQKIKIENLEKKLYFNEYAPKFAWNDKYYKYSIEDLQNLIEAAHELYSFKYVPKGEVAPDEQDFDVKVELKEDLREMIFNKRKDGKSLKNLHRETDLDKNLRF